MATHWTYEDVVPDSDLDQGDIIASTPALRGLFEEVHPHFLDPKYLAFIVLTQSCDLVRRGGSCKSRYITLACIRSLEGILLALLDQVCSPIGQGVYREESRVEARRLLHRILNQNEQALGLFYLHPDADVGIAVPSVAILQVSIAVRRAHYEKIAEDRTGKLRTQFRNKLGWLVGNLYSRVGTPDWGDQPDGRKEVEKIIDDHLRGADTPQIPKWVSGEAADAAWKAGVDLSSLPADDIVSQAEAHAPPPLKESLVAEARRVLEELLEDAGDGGLSEGDLEKFQNRLANDARFAQLVRSVRRP